MALFTSPRGRGESRAARSAKEGWCRPAPASARAGVYVCMYICVYVYIYIYTYIYTYIYIYMYTYMLIMLYVHIVMIVIIIIIISSSSIAIIVITVASRNLQPGQHGPRLLGFELFEVVCRPRLAVDGFETHSLLQCALNSRELTILRYVMVMVILYRTGDVIRYAIRCATMAFM